MPPVKNSYDGALATAAYDVAGAWHTADVMGIGADPPAKAASDDLKGWGTAQVNNVAVGEWVCALIKHSVTVLVCLEGRKASRVYMRVCVSFEGKLLGPAEPLSWQHIRNALCQRQPLMTSRGGGQHK